MSKATSVVEASCGGVRYKLRGPDSVAYNILFTTSLTSASPGVLDGFGFSVCCRSLTPHLRLSLGILTVVENSRPALYFARGPNQKLALFDKLVNPGLTEDICA